MSCLDLPAEAGCRTPRGPATPAVRSGRAARLDAAVRTGAVTVLWCTVLLVTYWWVADGGLGAIHSEADGLISAGRLTGLVATVLLTVQVLLMARVPVLERAFGQDRLAHLHRRVGFCSFTLMVAHVGLTTWGYAGGRWPSVPATAWDLTANYPGMLLAVAGTACLVLVVVTSVRAARRRLRYESWHLLHLYAYLGVGLALPHQLWTGSNLLASPVRTAFWWTMEGAALAAVVVWRVGLPVVRTLSHRLVVDRVVREAPGVVSVHLTGSRLGAMPVQAGQFLSWRFLAGSGWTRANPYSLSAAPDGRSLRITVQAVGDGSTALAGVRPGTRVLVEGPYGRLSPRARTRRKVALIGAGVGITPLRALAEGLDYAPGDVVVLHRFRDSPLFGGEFDQLVRDRGLQVLNLPGPRRAAGSWLGPGVGPAGDLAALRAWLPDVADRDVYVCGPQVWTDLVRATLRDAGVPADRVHLETFAW